MPLSHDSGRYLRCLWAIGSAVSLFLTAHPQWENPWSSGLGIAMLLVLAVGIWFQARWVTPFLFIAGFVVLAVLGLEKRLFAQTWSIFLLATLLFIGAGVWSHRAWLRKPWPTEDDDVEETPEDLDFDDAEVGGGWHPDDVRVLKGLKPKRKRGGLLYALRPRSRTALFYALACLCIGGAFADLMLHADEPLYAVLLALPEVILAGAFWFHQSWIRVIGPLVCVGWAAFVFIFLILPNPTILDPLNGLVLAFLFLAWQLRKWRWEAGHGW